jgi:hypothetical protein
MHEHSRLRGEEFCNLLQPLRIAALLNRCLVQLEVAAEAILQKVTLLPAIEFRIELRL